MKKVFRRLKFVFLGLLGVLALFALGIAVFVNTAPQFGADPVGDHLKRIEKSPNHKNGLFTNSVPSRVGGDGNMLAVFKEYMASENSSPIDSIPSNFTLNQSEKVDTIPYLTWFGHSTFLLEFEELNILLDPMLGLSAAPVSFFGKRFAYTNAIDLTLLPKEIDAVIMSHDHYDHLDFPSIMAIKDQVKHFYMPLGMGAHFLRWGVPSEKITELDWWDSAKLGNLEFIATPARHFSGRGITNRFKTLWASWVIRSSKKALFFSGDSGYFEGFKEIGEKYGPFDFCMMECGQYNTQWADIHMMPEESVQAHLDLNGKIMMPIHWGAFTLAPHAWYDPINRAQLEAQKREVKLYTPIVGERFAVSDSLKSEAWWKDIE